MTVTQDIWRYFPHHIHTKHAWFYVLLKWKSTKCVVLGLDASTPKIWSYLKIYVCVAISTIVTLIFWNKITSIGIFERKIEKKKSQFLWEILAWEERSPSVAQWRPWRLVEEKCTLLAAANSRDYAQVHDYLTFHFILDGCYGGIFISGAGINLETA